jgi:hypothetical protein
MHEHDEDEWDDDEDDGFVEDDDDDVEEDEDDGVEDEIAAYAVSVWEEIEGDDELAEASREALVLIAQEALAKKEARLRREEAARQRRLARDRAEADERFARREAERRAQEAHRRAVEEAHTRIVRVDARPPARAPTLPASPVAGRRVGSMPVAAHVARPVVPVRAERRPLAIATPDDDDDEFDDLADHFREAATEAARVVLADAVPGAGQPDPRAAEEPIRFPSGHDAPPLTGADLTAWRTRHGLTQQAAADRLGVRQGTVSKAEGRSGALLGPALRDALADVLADGRHPA